MIRNIVITSLRNRVLSTQYIGRQVPTFDDRVSVIWPVESRGQQYSTSATVTASVIKLQQCKCTNRVSFSNRITFRTYTGDADSYEQYVSSPFSTPYQESFIDGPMMPRAQKQKKKKKKKKPEKPIPLIDSKEQALEKMKIRFDEIEKEHLGPKRGIRTVKWIAGKKCEGLHKAVTTKMANSILNSWIYCRHALQHGHYQLNDMTKDELAESLLGKGTKTKVTDRDARLILKELFRFGKSGIFDHYMKLHNEKMKMMGKQAVATERNRLGIPKIRNLATIEEMTQHGYTQEEIDAELQSRAKKEANRRNKKLRREAPAYLRHEVSGARRQEARKIKRILARKEKKRLLRQREREAELGISSGSSPVRGTEDTDIEDDDDDDYEDDYDSDEIISNHDDDYSSSEDEDDDDNDDKRDERFDVESNVGNDKQDVNGANNERDLNTPAAGIWDATVTSEMNDIRIGGDRNIVASSKTPSTRKEGQIDLDETADSTSHTK